MRTRIRRATWQVGAVALLLLSSLPAAAHEGGSCGDRDEERDDRGERELARRRVHWRHPHRRRDRKPIEVQLLGFNDFHGQLSTGRLVANRPVGGAAVLASYLHDAAARFEGETFIVHAGDHVGASPAASALLQDEPSIQFLNLLAGKHCRFRDVEDPQCNLVGTLGNHEFDDGAAEMLRLIYGGNHDDGPFLERHYRGARFPYISANVVDADNGRPILPPYVIKKVRGTEIGFIGAVLEQTPSIVTPSGVAGLRFLDEADAINRYVRQLRRRGVETIVVLIHQGGTQTTYAGDTDPGSAPLVGTDIRDIVARLDSAVDVVVSGHAHSFTNALVDNAEGHSILVTQAFSAGTAYGAIALSIDPVTNDVVEKSASIVTTFGDAGPGLVPDPAVAALVKAAEDTVAPLVNQVFGSAGANITRTQNAAGESALGNLIADAQRASMHTDFAFMNPGGIRADLPAGPVTWGDLFTIQPFGNSLVKMDLTGAQVHAVLEQQWLNQSFPRLMSVSGLTYTWDNDLPAGSRVVEVRRNGTPIDKNATFTITCNSFMAAGGDNFTVFNAGTNRVGGAIDLDALIEHVKTLLPGFTALIEGRVTRLH